MTVQKEYQPINKMRNLIVGSNPLDDGHFVFTAEERDAFLANEPGAEELFHPYLGAREYLQGKTLWILTLHNASPATLARLPRVQDIISAVRSYRKNSKSLFTQSLAETPTIYHLNVIPRTPFLVIPQTSSERRDYVPMGWLEPPVIPSVKLIVLEDARLIDFALLTSAIHMSWMRTVTGRMKSDYSYSIGLVYNTFPTPPGFNGGTVDLIKLESLAQSILDARAVHPDTTPAELYDPDLMPPNLRRAHQALDRTVDRLYRKSGFASERERVEHLFMLYEKLRAPLEAGMKAKPKRRRGGDKLE